MPNRRSTAARAPLWIAIPGAWQEILPAGGPPARFGGIDFGQHGEISTLPWRCELLEDRPEEVAVRLTVQTIRTPFQLVRIMRLRRGDPTLYLEETLHNRSPQRLPVMWGHHPAFGGGLLDESCIFEIAQARVEVPAEQSFETQRVAGGFTGDWPVVPGAKGGTVDLSRMPAPDAGTADYFYLTDLSEGRYRIINRNRRLAVELNWDLAVMPHLWFWQVAGGAPDYPWWSQTYSMALEPFSSKVCNYQQAVDNDDVVWLDPHGRRSFNLSVSVRPE